MDIAEFEDLLDRLGEDISLWPAPQQQAAEQLLQDSEEARALLADAVELRQLLAPPPIRAEAGLADRIMLRIRDVEPSPALQPEVAAEPAAPQASPEEPLQEGLLKRPLPWLLLGGCIVAGLFAGLLRS